MGSDGAEIGIPRLCRDEDMQEILGIIVTNLSIISPAFRFRLCGVWSQIGRVFGSNDILIFDLAR